MNASSACLYQRSEAIRQRQINTSARVNYANLFELVLCSLVCSLLIGNKSFQIIIMLVLNVFKQSLLISSHLL